MGQVETIKDRVSIREVLGALGVVVKRNTCLCPLHPDKTPSLSFSDKGLWYCFVCGIGGDQIELVMKVENLTFKESLSWFNEKFSLGLTAKRYKPNPMREALLESYVNLKRDFLQELNDLQVKHRVLMRIPNDCWDAKDYTFAEVANEMMDTLEDKLKALEHARYSIRS